MDIKDAALTVKQTLDELHAELKVIIFDEWVILQIFDHQWKVLMYQSPRKEEFKARFKEDVSSLKPLDPSLTQVGEFSFCRDGKGTRFDAYLHAGDQIFFLFNNTRKSANEITSDASWKTAQTSFEHLQEIFILDPVETEETV